MIYQTIHVNEDQKYNSMILKPVFAEWGYPKQVS
jgi:hypothetical protein